MSSEEECEPHFSWLADSAPHVMVYPMLSDTGTGAGPFASTLAVGHKRTALIEEIALLLQERRAAGMVIDTKYLPATSHRNLIVFLYELRTRLAPDNRSLILTVDIGLDSVHLQQLARTANYVIAEAYDQTSEREAGPVAAQGWFESRVSEIAAKIDRNKLIIGIGSFGYEWKQGTRKRVSVQYVWDKVALFGGQIHFDARSLNPAFQYHEDNVRSDVWYLDAATVFNEMRSALSVRPAGHG